MRLLRLRVEFRNYNSMDRIAPGLSACHFSCEAARAAVRSQPAAMQAYAVRCSAPSQKAARLDISSALSRHSRAVIISLLSRKESVPGVLNWAFSNTSELSSDYAALALGTGFWSASVAADGFGVSSTGTCTCLSARRPCPRAIPVIKASRSAVALSGAASATFTLDF